MAWVFRNASWARLPIQIVLLPIRGYHQLVKLVLFQISAQRSHFLGKWFPHATSFLYSYFSVRMNNLMSYQMLAFRSGQSLSSPISRVLLTVKWLSPAQVPRGCISIWEYARKARSPLEVLSSEYVATPLTDPPHEFQSCKNR